jgi:hypothetical protein
MTEQQRAKVVEALRRKRAEYIVKSTKRKAARRKPDVDTATLSFKDLDLDVEDLLK